MPLPRLGRTSSSEHYLTAHSWPRTQRRRRLLLRLVQVVAAAVAAD
jgi:hypothetical protein